MSPEWSEFIAELGIVVCVFILGVIFGLMFVSRIGRGRRIVVHSLDDTGVWTLCKTAQHGWLIEALDGTWNRLYDPNWDTLEEEREFWNAVIHAIDNCPHVDGRPVTTYPEVPLAFKTRHG